MSKKRYYRQSVGEVVSQVYEVEANSWVEAKKAAFDDMKVGDILAECPPSAVKSESDYPEYRYIDKDQCTEYAELRKGTWAQTPNGKEYWEPRAWFFSDAPETFLNGDGEEFAEWEQDDED